MITIRKNRDNARVTIHYVGAVALIGMVGLVVALWAAWRNSADLAIVTGLIGAISSPIGIAIGALLNPGGSTHESATRTGDAALQDPTGKPQDPIFVAPAPGGADLEEEKSP